MTITKILAAPTGSGKTSFPAASPYVNPSLLNGSVPTDFSLPPDHTQWRKGQDEILNWLTDCNPAPTISLCRTKNLQIHQYASEYGFDYLTGKANWPCRHPLNPGASADECLYGSNMHACAHANGCKYLVKKRKVKDSERASLNYAYYLVSGWPREKFEDDPNGYLFADECHELSELIIGYVSITVTKRDRADYDLPRFPKLRGKSASGLMAGTGIDVVEPALVWLNSCLPIMKLANANAEQQLTNERLSDGVTDETRKHAKRTANLYRKVENAKVAIDTNRDAWYIASGPNARYYQGRGEPAFVAKPLTASNYYKHYFEHGQQTVLMSATIGGVEEFTAELGLTPDEYEFRSVPNQFTAEQRPIYALDCPSMGAKKNHESWAQFNARFDKQADVIAQAILDCPSDWSGLIHVTRKKEAQLLADRLSKRGLRGRVWPSTGAGDEGYVPTDRQVLDWQNRKRRVPNSIGIFWSLWEGYNGLDEKINVICKAPFPVYGSPGSYEEAHRKYSNRRYRWTTAVKLAQAAGRTRRGRPGDYDTPTEKRGLVAIADKSWTQCKRYLPQDILDSIIKL